MYVRVLKRSALFAKAKNIKTPISILGGKLLQDFSKWYL